MKHLVYIEIMQIVEVEAENAEAAIEVAKSKLDPRIAASASIQVIQEANYNEESNSYSPL